VYEDNNDLVFEVDTPGVSKDDLDVSLEDNRLVIQGERREEKDVEEEERNYFRSERVYGTFQRSFRLPKNVNADEITANYDGGVLRVRVPKNEEASTQSIQIQ
jgi:HSP20 family protein